MPEKNKDYDLLLVDGEKSVRLQDFPPEAWRTIIGEDTSVKELEKLSQQVPWLFRGINIRANALAKVPFSITNDRGEIIDTSADYQNAVEFWPNPKKQLRLIEASLTMVGRAYLFKLINKFNFVKGVRYLNPTSIKPKTNSKEGLVGFKRKIGSREIPLTPEELVWFWPGDVFTEIGPPPSSPVKAAIRAAGVLFNVDTFVESFFKRGMIKATILAVARGTSKLERTKLKSWFKRVMAGVKNVFGTAVMSDDQIKPTIIGEGIQELSNTELTKEKREDIAVALGVPQNILFSNDANFATAKQEDFRLYDQTVSVEVILIEGVLNLLLFQPQGFQIKFHPQALQIFQEEEVNRSAALVNLERAGVAPWDGMQILGYDLPADMNFDDIEKQIREYMEFKSTLRIPTGNPAMEQGPNTAPSSRTSERTMMDRYKTHALKNFKAGKPIKGTKGAQVFDSKGKVSRTLMASVSSALNNVKTNDDINRIFAHAKSWEDYP